MANEANFADQTRTTSVMTEREAIVAWLRAGQAEFHRRAVKAHEKGRASSAADYYKSAGHYENIADAIERGDHLNKDWDNG